MKKFVSVPYPKRRDNEGQKSDFEISVIKGESITIRYIGELPRVFFNPDRTRDIGRHRVKVVKKGEPTPKNNSLFIIEERDVTFNIGDLVVKDHYQQYTGNLKSISPKTVTISDGPNHNRRMELWYFCKSNYTFSFERYNRNHDDRAGLYLHHPDDDLYK